MHSLYQHGYYIMLIKTKKTYYRMVFSRTHRLHNRMLSHYHIFHSNLTFSSSEQEELLFILLTLAAIKNLPGRVNFPSEVTCFSFPIQTELGGD